MPIPIGIGASIGSSVLGLNKWKTPLVSWLEIQEKLKQGFCEKNGYQLPGRLDEWEEPLNPKMASIRWGHAFEDAICELIGNVELREKVFTHKKYDFLTCHIDGIKNGVLQENKTTMAMAFSAGWGEPGSDLVPIQYQIQGQHQMMMPGTPNELDFNVLVFPKAPATYEKEGFRIDIERGYIIHPNGHPQDLYDFALCLKNIGNLYKFHIKADKEAQKEMLKKYLLFWNDNVLKEIPPFVSDHSDIQWLIKSPEGEIEADERMKELWSESCDCSDEIDSIVKRKNEIKDLMAEWTQKQIMSKNVKTGNEKNKLNVYSGRRKIFSVTKAYPGIKASRSMVDSLKEDCPKLYEEMKKTSFLDLIPGISLTEKQAGKVEAADESLKTLNSERMKAIKPIKLTKLLNKDSIFKVIKANKPELYKELTERGVVEYTTPKSTLRISRSEKD